MKKYYWRNVILSGINMAFSFVYIYLNSKLDTGTSGAIAIIIGLLAGIFFTLNSKENKDER